MKDLKNYMMIFRFEPNMEYQPSPEDMQKQNKAWGAFIGNLAISERLVGTNRLGFEGKQLQADLSSKDGICISEGKTIGGNLIVRASNINEALELAKECPILNMGGTVELRDIMPM